MSQELVQSVLNVARNDKFIMIVTFPLCMKDILVSLQERSDKTSGNLDSFEFSVMNIPLPEFEGTNQNLHYSGGNFSVSTMSRPEMADLNVSVKVQNTYTNWWFVYKWMNMIHDQFNAIPDADGQYKPTYNFLPKDYMTDITVYALDEYNKQVMRWDYKYCYPVKIGEYRNAAEFSYNGSPSEIVAGIRFKYSTVIAEPIISIQE